MIKSELIAQLATKLTHIPERDVALCVNTLLDYMSDELSQNRRIEIRGYGSFSLHYRAPRNAHNPKTGEHVRTEAKYTPHFKPGKGLRERVNESKATHPIKQDDRDDD